MITAVKPAILAAAKTSGCFAFVRSSRWRSERLLILCYHGISQRDEHLWSPGLYLSPQAFRRRLEMLAEGGYQVLSLTEGLARLRSRDLPPRSVVLTFDDGFYDFYATAFPILKEFGFPATVYLTTHYARHRLPIFNLVIHYLMWRKRGLRYPEFAAAGPGCLDLTTDESLYAAFRRMWRYADEAQLSTADRDALAASLADLLGEDYASIKAMRMFQIMDRGEIAAVASAGCDIQLHTHRHRVPLDRNLFLAEIRDNRRYIEEVVGLTPSHFCYPSGVHRSEFLPWLEECDVRSATTCNAGLAHPSTPLLLLPRVLDSHAASETDFESWISGFRPRLMEARA